MIERIIFDADDTLWHNENKFTATHDKFREMLLDYHDAKWIDERLYETERHNLSIFGYGVKGFMLSMIETAIELTEARISGAKVQEIINLGKDMLQGPVDPLPYVRETLEALSHKFPLMVITKGDLFDQETKLANSGLGDFFDKVEVVSEKNTDAYTKIFQRHELNPNKLVMVGNSLKSDILPVLPLNVHGIHIPYHTTWVHERVNEEALADKHFHALASMADLPALIKELAQA